MDLRDSRSEEGLEEEQGGSVEVEVDHVETPAPAQLMEASEGEELTPGSGSVENSVEEVEVLEDKTEDEGRKDPEDEKSPTKRQYDDLQQVERDEKKSQIKESLESLKMEAESPSPVKRRQRNLDIRREAIEKFEEEIIAFVWDYLSVNYAGKFLSAESIYEFSIKTVQDKILQPEVGSYSKVIEKGGSWAEFKVNRAIEENVKKFLDKLMSQ